MLLHRIHLNPRNGVARRDLSDPYQMHATLCRAFSPSETRCPPGSLLWRLEPETDANGNPRLLIQSKVDAEWSRLPSDWLAPQSDGNAPISQSIDLAAKLNLESLIAGRCFRFRLQANPCKTVQGKRSGLLDQESQRIWLARMGDMHGFSVCLSESEDFFDSSERQIDQSRLDVRVVQDRMLVGKRHDGSMIRVFSALFEGRIEVTAPERFRLALGSGIGHGKVMGLGLLSVVPVRTTSM